MIEIGNAIVSFDVIERRFVCDLVSCKGACCVEGDGGAPLEKDEIQKLNDLVQVVKDDLSEASVKVIASQGVSYVDIEGDEVTSIVDGKECVFSYKDENGFVKCAIEKAYREGKTDFMKPISCHLYPIRLKKLSDGHIGLNVHKWEICKCARQLGSKLDVPVYQFLKEPLIRRFGKEWYEELELVISEMRKQGMVK